MSARPRPLAALYNRATLYECALFIPGKPPEPLAYVRKTRAKALQTMLANRERLLALIGDSEAPFEWDSERKRWKLPRGIAIGFTHRTERDAAQQAEGVRAYLSLTGTKESV